MPFTDLMVDLETLGTRPTSVFVQIGLCAFNLVPEPGNNMVSTNIHVNIDSALRGGLTVDGGTIQYWLTEGVEARSEMAQPGGLDLREAMVELVLFVARTFTVSDMIGTRTLERVWGNGPSFDISMLDHASAVTRVTLPWSHRQVRCVRTLRDISPDSERPEPGVAHVGEQDALAQAEWVQNMWLDYLDNRARGDAERAYDGS